MRGAERIVIALAALGEAGEAAACAQRADAVAASGQDLVRVGLMANVPDQAVARGVEGVMDGGGQFDHAEAGAEMAAGHRDGIDGFLAQFVGDLPNLLDLEPAQVFRRADGVKKRRFTKCGHGDIPIFAGRGEPPDARWGRSGCAVKSQTPEAGAVRRFLIESLDALRIAPCDMHHSGGFTLPGQFFFSHLKGLRTHNERQPTLNGPSNRHLYTKVTAKANPGGYLGSRGVD